MIKRHPPSGEADYLFNNPLLNEVFDRLEANAIDIIILTDKENERAEKAYELRAIRNIRNELKSLAKGKITRA